MSRHKCLILGASGLVGQRLQQRLANHPMFEICAVAGSKRTAGNELAALEHHIQGAAASKILKESFVYEEDGSPVLKVATDW